MIDTLYIVTPGRVAHHFAAWSHPQRSHPPMVIPSIIHHGLPLFPCGGGGGGVRRHPCNACGVSDQQRLPHTVCAAASIPRAWTACASRPELLCFATTSLLHTLCFTPLSHCLTPRFPTCLLPDTLLPSRQVHQPHLAVRRVGYAHGAAFIRYVGCACDPCSCLAGTAAPDVRRASPLPTSPCLSRGCLVLV